MQKYARLSEAGSLHDGTLPEFSPPFATEYDLNPSGRWDKVRASYLHSGASCKGSNQLRALNSGWPWIKGAHMRWSLLRSCLQVKQWWRVRVMGEPSEPIPPSGYMTLIPLNGARRCALTMWACHAHHPSRLCKAEILQQRPSGMLLTDTHVSGSADARLKPQRKLLFFSCMVRASRPACS